MIKYILHVFYVLHDQTPKQMHKKGHQQNKVWIRITWLNNNTHAHAHTHTHAHAHKHIHTHKHKYTHTRTHTNNRHTSLWTGSLGGEEWWDEGGESG